MEENMKKLAALNETAQSEAVIFAGGNKSAGTRLRKALQDIKVLSQEIRKEVQEIKNK
jgi:hypothetical protein